VTVPFINPEPRSDWEAALAELLPQHLSQARSTAWKFYQSAPQALELEELISLAYEGLAKARSAWPSYCESRGYDPGAVQFLWAYCSRRINGAILDHMRTNDHVTRSVRGKLRKIKPQPVAAPTSPMLS
jgi:DNA-directed RNA polymerase specialized sigma subunit